MADPPPTPSDGTETEIGANVIHRPRPWKTALDVVASVVMIAAGIAIIFSVFRKPVPPGKTVSIADAMTVGRPDAPVAMVEFSDFQCPFCARFARDTLPPLVRQYVESGLLLIAFRHFPTNRAHPFAFMAAEAVECARRQGKGWAMHDALFKNPAGLSESEVRHHSQALGLESEAFAKCRKGGAVANIRRDIEDATNLSIAGTPAFLIGALEDGRTVRVTETVSGAESLAIFAASIDRALSKAGFSKNGTR